MGLALGAVVELVLPQLLLPGEGLQAAVQADGLGLRPAGLLHAAVLLHDLQGEQAVSRRQAEHTAHYGDRGFWAVSPSGCLRNVDYLKNFKN